MTVLKINFNDKDLFFFRHTNSPVRRSAATMQRTEFEQKACIHWHMAAGCAERRQYSMRKRFFRRNSQLNFESMHSLLPERDNVRMSSLRRSYIYMRASHPFETHSKHKKITRFRRRLSKCKSRSIAVATAMRKTRRCQFWPLFSLPHLLCAPIEN